MRENATKQMFRDKFLAAAERHLGMSRYERGFPMEIVRSLKLRQASVAQRWIAGRGLPRLPHLLKIYREWGITPNELLGIEEEMAQKKR